MAQFEEETEENEAEETVETKAVRRTKPFTWDRKKDLAARLFAEGGTYDRIAEQVGVCHVTLQNWRKRPEFIARQDTYLRSWTAENCRLGIGQKAKRLAILNELHEAQQEIKRQRAIAHGKKVKKVDETTGKEVEEAVVPGGDTGFMVIKTRRYFEPAETSEDAPQEVIIEEVAFDAAFSREMRATLQQAGEEAGEIVSKTEVSGPGGGPIGFTIAGIDELANRIKMAKQSIADEDGE